MRGMIDEAMSVSGQLHCHGGQTSLFSSLSRHLRGRRSIWMMGRGGELGKMLSSRDKHEKLESFLTMRSSSHDV